MSISSTNYEMKASLSLNENETAEISSFLQGFKYQPHFHNPYWAELVEPYKQPLYIRFYEEAELAGVATIYTVLSFSILWFGPVVKNKEKVSECIDKIVEYLNTKKIGLLKIIPVDNEFDITTDFFKTTKLKNRIYFEKKGWSTIKISVVGKTSEDVFRNFSKGHKSSIKKAQKEGVEAIFIDNKKHLKQLSGIYDNMHHRKGLILPLKDSKTAFNKIFDLKLGVFIGVFKNNDLLGGIVCVSEGDSLLYKFGASDIKYHHVPVLHVAIFKMLQYAMETKHEKVDLCGYLPDAKQDSYSYGVNLFKKGFGGEIVEYRPAISIRINFQRWLLFNVIVFLSNIIPLSVKKIIYTARTKILPAK